jgi:hypothetical protein
VGVEIKTARRSVLYRPSMVSVQEISYIIKQSTEMDLGFE